MTNVVVPTTETEYEFWQHGVMHVAGLDEAGRGPWAGPVYAAAVVLPQASERLDALRDVRDSKKLSHLQRQRLLDLIERHALAVGVGWSDACEIDELGIVPATRLAMRRALQRLPIKPQALILDDLRLPDVAAPQKAFPRADASCLSVAAASIVAKVSRDRWMMEIAETRFPGYGFAQHKGYGTRQHRERLNQLGVCSLHRRSFRPIADMLRENEGSDA